MEYALDTNGVVSNWNSGAQRTKGYTAHEIVGKPFSCFYTLEDRKTGAPERSLATALAEGKYETEGWRVRKDGTRFWAHVVIDPIDDDDGELLGFAKVTRDRTEARALQQQTRDHEPDRSSTEIARVAGLLPELNRLRRDLAKSPRARQA